MSGPRIVLVRTKSSENVGAAARAMKNFGLDELVLVAPRCRLDGAAYALASHAGEVLDRARVVDTPAEAVEGCRLALGTTARPRASESFRAYEARPAAARFSGPGVAILFGPEDFGLGNADLDHCQGYITIPTGAYASLNLAQAVNIVAYEWFMAGHREQAAAGPEPAPREELEGMYGQLMDVLHLIGYTDVQRQEAAERLFRGIFDHAELSVREVLALRGLWRQVRWAARQEPGALPGARESETERG